MTFLSKYPLYFLLLTLFVLGLSLQPASAQKILQMEKYGKVKTKRYYLGDELIYQLKDDKNWYSATIDDIKVEEKIVLFNNRYVKLDEIHALKSFHNRGWSSKAGYSLMVFGGSWSFFALGGMLIDADRFAYQKSDAIVTGTALLSGWLIQKLFKSKTYKMGKRKWLRVLDISPIEKND